MEIALREFPKMSSRALAQMCGVDDSTVAAHRTDTCGIPAPDRTGQDGKSYPPAETLRAFSGATLGSAAGNGPIRRLALRGRTPNRTLRAEALPLVAAARALAHPRIHLRLLSTHRTIVYTKRGPCRGSLTVYPLKWPDKNVELMP